MFTSYFIFQLNNYVCYVKAHLFVLSEHFLSTLKVSRPWALLYTMCTRASFLIVACHHSQDPSLPLSLLTFITLVLLSFSKLLNPFLFPNVLFQTFQSMYVCTPFPQPKLHSSVTPKVVNDCGHSFKVTKMSGGFSLLPLLHLLQ